MIFRWITYEMDYVGIGFIWPNLPNHQEVEGSHNSQTNCTQPPKHKRKRSIVKQVLRCFISKKHVKKRIHLCTSHLFAISILPYHWPHQVAERMQYCAWREHHFCHCSVLKNCQLVPVQSIWLVLNRSNYNRRDIVCMPWIFCGVIFIDLNTGTPKQNGAVFASKLWVLASKYKPVWNILLLAGINTSDNWISPVGSTQSAHILALADSNTT